MKNQPAAFSVLSAPVALCDRRALSEAWYSALHVHTHSPSRGNAAAATVAVDADCGNVFVRSRAGMLEFAAPRPNIVMRVGAAAAPAGPPPHERRTVRSRLAQNIVRTFSKPQTPPKHASFALEGNRGRVQILLRESGCGTQIVALCPPAAREHVARALHQARYALALRGISLAAEVRGFAQS